MNIQDKLIREDLIEQYRHFWRTFSEIISDFDEASWIESGFGVTTPARLACHLLQSSRYYIKDTSEIVDPSGKPFDLVCSEVPKETLPSPEDVLSLSKIVGAKVEVWLQDMDFRATNTDFVWTGKTMQSVALFMLRHHDFHLGELNALLNDHLSGSAPDHFAETL
jgi:hypothetical protein